MGSVCTEQGGVSLERKYVGQYREKKGGQFDRILQFVNESVGRMLLYGGLTLFISKSNWQPSTNAYSITPLA